MSEPRCLVICCAYLGRCYSGFQYQENAPSIQGCLERAASKICKEAIRIHGCSRTDAGVHAHGHVSHFITSCPIPVERLALALNAHLPEDISVLAAAEMPLDFHARFDACGKSYSYRYYLGNARHALYVDQSSFVAMHDRELDLQAMREAAEMIRGKKDFKCFQAAGSDLKGSTVREVDRLELSFEDSYRQIPGKILRLDIHGSGFLYNMVRIIAGTLLYIGQGRLELSDLEAALRSGDRRLLGKTMPAAGLCLESVDYPSGHSPDFHYPDSNRPTPTLL
ncbi:MAG: tRNA pseudouridine(38-40) synthase TruA [Eubacteriales bacterium]|nr:tRNA pseudouridine(38-40) synthase TruA [Eubacteriales bacterium]